MIIEERCGVSSLQSLAFNCQRQRVCSYCKEQRSKNSYRNRLTDVFGIDQFWHSKIKILAVLILSEASEEKFCSRPLSLNVQMAISLCLFTFSSLCVLIQLCFPINHCGHLTFNGPCEGLVPLLAPLGLKHKQGRMGQGCCLPRTLSAES